MKKILILSLAIFLTSLANTQIDDLPSVVSDAFTKKYPNAKRVYGYLEESYYKIEFSQAVDTYTAFFLPNGKWIETAKIISDNEVPQKVITVAQNKYPGSEISYAEFVENGKNEKFYRINSYDDEAEYIIDVSAEGTILNSQKKASLIDYYEG